MSYLFFLGKTVKYFLTKVFIDLLIYVYVLRLEWCVLVDYLHDVSSGASRAAAICKMERFVIIVNA